MDALLVQVQAAEELLRDLFIKRNKEQNLIVFVPTF